MRMIVIIGFAAGLAAASPASAADSNAGTNANANRSDATARDQAQANGAAERRICVRETGSESHIRREICHTAREWRDLHGDDPNQG
jgi:hypothetical protein